jgi:glycine/D-amino acid oxidase-like deaminating enzyme
MHGDAESMNIAVIGGGAFGVMTAIRLAEMGETVSLFERLPDLMHGASFNANRLHLGFHYPRDEETARQCMRGYRTFREEFEGAISKGFTNAYFIASEGSLTSPSDFLAFCDRIGLPYREVELGGFQPAVQNVELGVMTEEVVYDTAVLRRLMKERLQSSGATIRLGTEVRDVNRVGENGYEISVRDEGNAGFDAVVNCCYADINRLTARLGHRIETRHYEYCAAPIIELDWPEPTSITVLDGPFMTLLPFGKAGQYLLYHVRHVVIAQHDEPLLDPAWLDPKTSPFAAANKQQWFKTLLESCCKWIPALREARLIGFLEGPRMVLANREDTDARPSIVTQHERGYITVFSGKIDHCMWVAEEVVGKLGPRRRGFAT